MKSLVLGVLFVLSAQLCAEAATSEEIVIKSHISEIGTCPLGATLLVPKEAKKLAIFVHGSGPQNRDESNSQGYAPFRDLAEGMAKQGIASLRYDKRTFVKDCVKDVRTVIQLSPFHFIKDIENVLAFTAKEPKLAALDRFIVSHSQGVNFALELAAKKIQFPIKGAILLAGLGKYNLAETIMRQFADLAKKPGKVGEQYKKVLAQAKEYFDRLKQGGVKENERFGGAYRNFWRDSIIITDRAANIARQARVPSLLLQGDQDWNITIEDFEALRTALAPTHTRASAHLLKGIDHALVRAPSKKVAPDLIEKITTWILFSNPPSKITPTRS